MIRPALPEEFPSAPGDMRFVCESDGKVEGLVCISVVDPRGEGDECWVHILEGTKEAAPALMSKARKWAWDKGFEDIWANIVNPILAVSFDDHGWSLEQAVFKSPTNWVRGNRMNKEVA